MMELSEYTFEELQLTDNDGELGNLDFSEFSEISELPAVGDNILWSSSPNFCNTKCPINLPGFNPSLNFSLEKDSNSNSVDLSSSSSSFFSLPSNHTHNHKEESITILNSPKAKDDSQPSKNNKNKNKKQKNKIRGLKSHFHDTSKNIKRNDITSKRKYCNENSIIEQFVLKFDSVFHTDKNKKERIIQEEFLDDLDKKKKKIKNVDMSKIPGKPDSSSIFYYNSQNTYLRTNKNNIISLHEHLDYPVCSFVLQRPLHTLSPLAIHLLKNDNAKQEKHYNEWISNFTKKNEINVKLMNRFSFSTFNNNNNNTNDLNFELKIIDIVARSFLNTKISIDHLAQKLNHAKIENRHIVLSNLYPTGSVTIYEQGKLKVTGFTKIEHGIYLIEQATERIKYAHNSWLEEEKQNNNETYLKHYHRIDHYYKFYIEQIRANANFQKKIQLSILFNYFEPEISKNLLIYRHHIKDEIDYDDGEFHKFNYKFFIQDRQDLNTEKHFLTIRIIHTGYIQFLGAKSPEEIHLAFHYIISILLQI